jgi:hypothetical protein
MSTPTSSAHGGYDAVASALINGAPAVSGTIFANPCLMIHGKVFAGRFGEGMVFKLGGRVHARVLSLAGARPFDPLKKGQPMKAWVEVPRRHANRWPALARAALRIVSKSLGGRLSPGVRESSTRRLRVMPIYGLKME